MKDDTFILFSKRPRLPASILYFPAPNPQAPKTQSLSMLNHQGLKQPKAKHLSKTAKFDEKQQSSSVFLALASLKLNGRTPNP